MPGEPLAERSEAEAGDLVVDGLVDRGVDDEPVQAVGHQPVGSGLQGFGREGPGVAIAGQGLGRDEVLAVDVGHGRGFADVGVVLPAGPAGPLEPHGAHRDVGQALDLHAVADEGAAGFVRFRVAAHAARAEDVGQLVVVVLDGQVGVGVMPAQLVLKSHRPAAHDGLAVDEDPDRVAAARRARGQQRHRALHT